MKGAERALSRWHTGDMTDARTGAKTDAKTDAAAKRIVELLTDLIDQEVGISGLLDRELDATLRSRRVAVLAMLVSRDSVWQRLKRGSKIADPSPLRHVLAFAGVAGQAVRTEAPAVRELRQLLPALKPLAYDPVGGNPGTARVLAELCGRDGWSRKAVRWCLAHLSPTAEAVRDAFEARCWNAWRGCCGIVRELAAHPALAERGASDADEESRQGCLESVIDRADYVNNGAICELVELLRDGR